MNNIANLDKEERSQLFHETAVEKNTTDAIVEKDFWVVWTLEKIFSNDRLNQILMFKGGTSLSKVYNLIGRFSEDIDLILDWREVSKEDPSEDQDSNSKQNKFNKKINENAKEYIKGYILPIVSALTSPLCSCTLAEDDFSINVKYPNAFEDEYLRSEILLEIGPLASWLPYDKFQIKSFAAEVFPKLFTKASCEVNTIVAKRTFWEKATILHHEANRPETSVMPTRYSRHYYDLAMMAKSEVKDEALSDLLLLEKVVEFKQKFYPRGWAKYEDAKPGSLKLLPPEFRYDALKKDYKDMGNMIFEKHISFDEVISTLTSLEKEIN